MTSKIVKKLLEKRENNLRLTVVEQTTAVNPLKDHVHEIVEHTALNMKYALLVTEKIQKSLEKRAEKASLPYSIVEEVYLRGCFVWEQIETDLDQSEYAFNRVNSYISGGHARKELDFDLEQLTEAERSTRNRLISAYENAYNNGIKHFKEQKKMNRENHTLRPENGMRVKIYGDHKHSGKEGVITQVSPSMQYVSVKTKDDKHIGIYHINNIKHLHAEA